MQCSDNVEFQKVNWKSENKIVIDNQGDKYLEVENDNSVKSENIEDTVYQVE